MKNTTEVCLAAGGVKPPKSVKRLGPHGFASANIVTDGWEQHIIDQLNDRKESYTPAEDEEKLI